MICKRFLLGCMLIIFLAASMNGNQTIQTTEFTSARIITTMNATVITSNTQTTASITTAHTNTTDVPTTAAVSTAAPVTTQSSSIPTTATPTTAKPITTTHESGRKFDGLSFIGGIILAGGLAILIILVVTYLRRTNRLPYSNLQ